MQERYDSFDTLEKKLLDSLKTRGCSPITITGYRYLCNSIIAWLTDNGHDFYTKKVVILFCRITLSNMATTSIIRIFEL